MNIDRINTNGSVRRKQDFLDLIFALQDENSTEVSVTYRNGRSLDIHNKTKYVRNIHTNQWLSYV